MGHANPAQETDGGKLNPKIAQPGGESAAHQQQGKTGGEPKEEHADDPGISIDPKTLQKLMGGVQCHEGSSGADWKLGKTEYAEFRLNGQVVER
jgi:hypothetical protein